MRLSGVLTFVAFLISSGIFSVKSGLSEEIEWKRVFTVKNGVKSVLLTGQDDLYIGCEDGVYKSIDRGKTWDISLRSRSPGGFIRLLVEPGPGAEKIYAASEKGIFVTSDRGDSWKRIFRGGWTPRQSATAFASCEGRLYLGTRAGLFVSLNEGRHWRRIEGALGESPIIDICVSSRLRKQVFVASREGVFSISQEAGFGPIKVFFASSAAENDAVEIEDNYDGDIDMEKDGSFGITAISQHPFLPGFLYLATNRGLYFTQNGAESWEGLTMRGLLSRDIKALAISKQGVLYSLSGSGVFMFISDRWQELSIEVMSKKYNAIAFDEASGIYLATDQGLFFASRSFADTMHEYSALEFYCQGEPSINEVHRAAMKYAEVEPEKIAKWRRQACRKALLPRLSVGLDRNTTDLWHWETGSTTKGEDDLLRRGKESVDWDIAISWELGDIIWNNDQTSIDTRSRLMVQLREDILDEVTKIYFERIRRKIELLNLPIEDRKKRLDKELGIRELTALLDAMTGGYFSSSIKN